MRRALTWLAVTLIVGLMVVLVAGAGWFIYGRVTGGLEHLKEVRKTPSSLDRPTGSGLPSGQGEGVIHALLGLYLRFRSGDLERPAGEGEPVVFTVQPGETARAVSERLAERGLIRDAGLFRLYMRYQGLDRDLEAGNHKLSSSMTIPQIAEGLRRARAEEVVVTIPEGWRMEQIAALLEGESVLPGQEFLALAREGKFDYPFHPNGYRLRDRPPDATLEGYLFPDTYRLPVEVQASGLIERMLRNFDRRVASQMRQDAAAQGLTLFQVITLASIVEREGALREELPLIASVYLNRLDQGMKLDADPTVQYALGFQPNTGQWWKRPLQLEEYAQVDSPYNTYLHSGLPPGPICSPGLAAIKAVIYPAQSDYLFFVRNGVADDGSHVFAKTLEEHERNRQRYQRSVER